MQIEKSFGVYIHWPFCISKCPYCDFNSHVRDKIPTERWEKALVQDLKNLYSLTSAQTVTSIFFGGGTPSLMPPQVVEKIIKTVKDLWKTSDTLEVTLEANPNSAEVTKFKDLSKAGINRVSLGIQALNQTDLKFLGRQHNLKEALQALEWAQEIFPRFSFDLIYTRPGQTLKAWEQELDQALKIAGGHLSLYQLTIEEGTPFFLSVHRGDFKMPVEDLSAEFYEFTQDRLEAAGLSAYEISNYAKLGEECRHNLTYWHYEDYVGAGPGAHSRITLEGEKHAIRRHRSPEFWMEQVEAGRGEHERIQISSKAHLEEVLMMGLRLKKGILRERAKYQLGEDLLTLLSSKKITALQEEGLLNINSEYIFLTSKGRQRLNGILNFLRVSS